MIDVVAASGALVAYLGHLGALLGTIWLLRSREPIRLMRRILPFGMRR